MSSPHPIPSAHGVPYGRMGHCRGRKQQQKWGVFEGASHMVHAVHVVRARAAMSPPGGGERW